MPAGHNGPYRNPETPVRNSAHWLITFSWLYRITSDERFLEAADRLASYLADPVHRPEGFSFVCRSGAKDACNGLIGQAWAMEGLLEAARLFGNDRFFQIALDLYNKHEFDSRHGVWFSLECDGRVLGEDSTFNHQLWFAATAAELLATVNATDHPSLKGFMENLSKNFTVLENGRIRHLIYHTFSQRNARRLVRRPIGYLCKAIGFKSIHERFDRREQLGLAREIGYQCFNLYAFARLALIFNQHPVFKSKEFRRAIDYLESSEYKQEIRSNPFSYGYNPPGFEVPLCLSAFSNRERAEVLQDARYWLESQLSRTYNNETREFDRNTEDPETLGARLYECSRFPEDILSLEINGWTGPASQSPS